MSDRRWITTAVVTATLVMGTAGCGSGSPRAKVAPDGSVTLSGSFCDRVAQFESLGKDTGNQIDSVDEDTDPADKAHAVVRSLTTSVDALAQIEEVAPDEIRDDVGKIHLNWSRTQARVAAVDTDDPDQVASAIGSKPVDQVVDGLGRRVHAFRHVRERPVRHRPHQQLIHEANVADARLQLLHKSVGEGTHDS